ncbi:helix-turn-helix transcriptional regulator [Herbivorax sp. ANBcel31]|uniref:helix-turn-helix domain-containing protein n=1 Tax=Herbivorax sp. ANBcel31 TaxID=3069754 RepID=UPI0027AE4882|nr:helix-turn-helix transcriptional regulator [Herbivorax sp. ANBcel31]MDQ2087895.1 helix-turn-helix transcriptional regulator [Herbivorax sp. ANBcel31]
MNLGATILELRTKANMSQEDLANALNVSRQSISKWETNLSVPELERLLKMSKLFNISIDELVQGSTEVVNKKSKDILDRGQIQGLEIRKIVGLGLIGIGFLFSILLFVFGEFFSALVLPLPFFITGLISLFVKKHTALWCGWAVYILISIYFRFAATICFWWVFYKKFYQGGLTIRNIVAWIMTIALGILIFLTIKANKHRNSPEALE